MTSTISALLGTLRSARGLSVDEAASGANITSGRLRRLERGAVTLEYLEGIRLAKALDLCPNCFRRFLEAAAERDELAASLGRDEATARRGAAQ